MAKRNKNPIPLWMGEPNEPFLRVAKSLMDSWAWKDLTPRQSRLYMAMARHYKGGGVNREVARKFPDIPELQRDDLFFYPWEEARRSGMYSDKRQFYTVDKKALEEHGFIKTFSSGKYHKMTIYQYSAALKEWKPPPK